MVRSTGTCAPRASPCEGARPGITTPTHTSVAATIVRGGHTHAHCRRGVGSVFLEQLIELVVNTGTVKRLRADGKRPGGRLLNGQILT